MTAEEARQANAKRAAILTEAEEEYLQRLRWRFDCLQLEALDGRQFTVHAEKFGQIDLESLSVPHRNFLLGKLCERLVAEGYNAISYQGQLMVGWFPASPEGSPTEPPQEKPRDVPEHVDASSRYERDPV
jgi:hypothetical protein